MVWPPPGAPTTRETFKQYCMRRLGKPLIPISVSDEQIDDRINDALQYYADYHFDGSEKIYYKYAITQTDIDNKYITIPENVLGIVRIFDGSSLWGGTDLFSAQYQLTLNEVYSFSNFTLVPYYMAMQHIALIEQVLSGQTPIRYNRHVNQLWIDTNWNQFLVGNFIVAEAYMVVDPDNYSNVWSDRFLQQYCTALIKRQWGNNLSLYGGMKLPGGIEFNGQRILDEATREIEMLEDKMVRSFSLPATAFIG